MCILRVDNKLTDKQIYLIQITIDEVDRPILTVYLSVTLYEA